MIPGKIIKFLEEYANLGFAGTRSRDLVPDGHPVSGWQAAPDGRRLTIYVAPHSRARLLGDLEDNGELAVTIEEYPSHETYQFKGRYLGHRPAQQEDLTLVDRIRARFLKCMRQIYPEGIANRLEASILPPSIAIEFEVSEVYLQTPGPGAGARLMPPEAAEA
jgi:hypothetical protein